MSDDNKIPSRYDGVSLLYYVDEKFKEYQNTRDAIVSELNRRLDILDTKVEDMRARDAAFYSKEMHDSYALHIAGEFKSLRNEIDQRMKPTYWWAGLLAAGVAALGGVWYLSDVIARLDIAQKHVIQELADHNKQMDQFNASLELLAKQISQKQR